MIINIHAGHNPDGKVACGAIGLIKESTEARNIKDKVISMLKSQGHTVYDCTVDNGANERDQLKKIVEKCNQHNVDLDISIHLNAGANKTPNAVTTGTEVFVLSSNSRAKSYAQNIVNSISSLGFKNRGVKYSTSLYVLKNTNSPAMLIEVCFIDDPDDVKIYNANNVAQAIVKGITGISSSIVTSPTTLYRVRKSWNDATSQIGAFNSLDKAKKVCKSGYYVYDDKGNVIYPKTNLTYQVRLLKDLNIYNTPDGKVVKINGAKKNFIYTITETSGEYGKLKSGAGWISVSDVDVKKV